MSCFERVKRRKKRSGKAGEKPSLPHFYSTVSRSVILSPFWDRESTTSNADPSLFSKGSRVFGSAFPGDKRVRLIWMFGKIDFYRISSVFPCREIKIFIFS